MKNLELVRILENIADILELQGIEFKPRAYHNAARSIATLPEDVETIYQQGKLEEIPGVGKRIAEKIVEYLKTGKIKYYQKLKKQVKIDLESLQGIPALGPKKIKFLYQKLKIKNLKDLELAIKKHKLQKLKGFGPGTEKNLLQGIQFVKSKPKRFLYAHVAPIVKEIKEKFSAYSFVQKIEIAGSFRRGKETIGDLDFLVVSKQPEKVVQAFLALPNIKKVIAKGKTKCSIRLINNLQLDLRIVKEKEFGSALLYFIGSKQHNIELRKIALSKGYTLSEYGLFNKKTKNWIAGRTEEEVYKKLGMRYIEPELRENQGELEASLKNKLPQLITAKDIKGFFHNHTKWTDGSASILEMAKEFEQAKYKFISFNDHFGPMKITHPLDEKRLPGYLKAIKQAQKKTKLQLFTGVEIDILKDGTLPLSKQKLQQLDVVIASVHVSTKMAEKEMTARVCSALENYPVNILGHPLDRLILERPPLNLNLKKLFQIAKQQNVFLEVNGSPQRIDLPSEQVKAAIKAGCKLALSLDAHDFNYSSHVELALITARRGWAEKKDVLNCWNLSKIKKALKIN